MGTLQGRGQWGPCRGGHKLLRSHRFPKHSTSPCLIRAWTPPPQSEPSTRKGAGVVGGWGRGRGAVGREGEGQEASSPAQRCLAQPQLEPTAPWGCPSRPSPRQRPRSPNPPQLPQRQTLPPPGHGIRSCFPIWSLSSLSHCLLQHWHPGVQPHSLAHIFPFSGDPRRPPAVWGVGRGGRQEPTTHQTRKMNEQSAGGRAGPRCH